MAWITPRTWVKGDFPTVSRLNTDLRDNMLFVGSCLGARVRPDTTNPQSIPTGNQTQVTFWNAEEWDSDNIHSQTSVLGRLTIRTAGKYFVGATISWQGVGGAANQKRVHIIHNRSGVDTEINRVQERGMEQNILTAETLYDCVPGDYIRCEVFQDTVGAINLLAGVGNASLSAYRISN
jgi:hypothetical protein